MSSSSSPIILTQARRLLIHISHSHGLIVAYYLIVFFPEWATFHTKLVTKSKFGYPFSWVTKRTPKTSSNLTTRTSETLIYLIPPKILLLDFCYCGQM